MKKIMSAVLALVMLFSMFAGGTTAWATGVQGDVTETPAAPEGKVFAGWYTDESLTTPYTKTTGSAYPKFVDEDVFGVWFQITYEANEENEYINLRVISTVDSLDYQKVGFKVVYNGGAKTAKPITTVFESLTGYGEGMKAFGYTPADASGSSESQYFFAYNCKLNPGAYDKAFTFTPYFVTKNGVEVELTDKARPFKATEDEYFNVRTISTAAELTQFAGDSQSNSFENWKIRLTADINLNPGWSASVSGYTTAWTTAIGNATYPFAGIFDGQGHTISGVYQSGAGTGLFKQTADTAVLKDFRLENSYFNPTDGGGAAAIAAQFAGKAERIYSDATVAPTGGSRYFGGMFGKTTGSAAVITECWFAGAVNASGRERVGGFMGGAAANTTVQHCLFTGTVTANGDLGTICGYQDSGTLAIDDTLCAALSAIIGSSNKGGFMGRKQAATKDITFSNSVLITKDVSTNVYCASSSSYWTATKCIHYTSRSNYNDFSGTSPVLDLSSYLDFTNYWILRQGDIPALKSLVSFADYTLDGESKPVYTISSAAELKAFAKMSQTYDFAGCTVVLAADIDLNPGWTASSTAPSNAWTAIASTSVPFAGIFDGQGHTISGVYQSAAGAGLFKQTASTAVLKDFRLENSYFNTTGGNTGTVAGVLGGNAEKIYSNATLKRDGYGDQKFGGLFGKTTGTEVTISECWFEGKVYGKDHVGGIIGGAGATQTNINHCLFIGGNAGGWLEGSSHVAGICGWVDTGCHLDVYDSLSAASNSIQAGSPAGIVGSQGSANAFTIDHSVLIHQDAPYTRAGTYPLPTNCERYTRTKTNWSEFYGSGGQTKMGAFLDFTNYWITRQGAVPALKNLSGFAGYELDGEGKPVYTIASIDDFEAFVSLSQSYNFANCTVKLAADIDLNHGWKADGKTLPAPRQWTTMIGSTSVPFAGTFDGQGHTISGVYRATTGNYSGLFAKTASTAVLKDFQLTNSYFTSNVPYEGSIAGAFAGKAEKIYSNATVVATGSRSRYGGLFGNIEGGGATITECWFNGTVNADGNSHVGGLIGTVEGSAAVTVSNSLFSGTVIGKQETSGICGYLMNGSLSLENTLSIGTITVQNTGNSGLLLGARPNSAPHLSLYRAVGVGSLNLTGSSGTNLSESSAKVSSRTAAALQGVAGAWLDQWLDFADWRLKENSVPVPACFGEGDAMTYTIHSGKELIKFAAASQESTFAGWTIRLDKDIDLNCGWAVGDGTPDTQWNRTIGTASKPFAGTFDGQGHTIRGVYQSATGSPAGFFGQTNSTAVVKNFRMENSYFVSTNNKLGSIAGTGSGQFYNLYSNASVTGNGWTGGLVGLATGLTMEHCQFGGTVTTTSSSTQGTGGLIACVFSGKNAIRNCYNTGTVNVTAYTAGNNTPMVGGLVGLVDNSSSGTTLVVESCLNTGVITKNSGHTYGFGRILGYGFGVTVIGSYGTAESCNGIEGNNGRPEEIETVAAASIRGTDAQTNMPLLDWTNSWHTVAGEFPALNFTDAGLGGSMASGQADSADLTQLNNLYSGTSLYQGDMHAHAHVDDKVIDKSAMLETWKSEMPGHALDFVADLHHAQTHHIENSAWDKDLFLYGTEPGTYISGVNGDGKAHYCMLFTTRDQLASVLTNEAFATRFAYNPSFNGYGLPNNGAYHYATFTLAEFKQLAGIVKSAGGLFVFPHPTLYNYSTNTEHYFTADGTGFEVIQGSMTLRDTSVDGDAQYRSHTRQNYDIWKELLAAGHKVWATAGSDIHGSLNDAGDKVAQKAIISVYAQTDNDNTYLSELVMDKLVKGNFSAGSVGIKMCIGGTPMGGTTSFSDKRLVVEVNGFHQYVSNATHKFHVRVITDKGIVYSQRIDDISTSTTLALDADENAAFYRVEVVDETYGRMISYGNPIWNGTEE